ncbi:MAG: hypothetical protein CMM50_17105 [Rhodospirillaceae bacterium]|nr:hypothetical protein [Rhodospirillaceae bacterium]
MAKPAKTDVVAALLERHGRTFAEEIGIDLSRNTPSPLFRWLCASILFSARIGAKQAISAARALTDTGWTTAEKMAASSWEERTRVLNRSGYARYDESTSRMLGDVAVIMRDRYQGDLRRLREQAGTEPDEERRLLKDFKGIGDVGADIFMREVQVVWPELYPFSDKKAIAAAKRLGLADDAASLAQLVDREDYPRLLAALVRTDLADDYDTILDATG